jgi:hypothetical protein
MACPESFRTEPGSIPGTGNYLFDVHFAPGMLWELFSRVGVGIGQDLGTPRSFCAPIAIRRPTNLNCIDPERSWIEVGGI